MNQFKRAIVGLGAAGMLAATVLSSGAVHAQDPVKIGVSWNNFQEERWGLWDEPAIKAAIEAAGATYISTDAASSSEQQLTDVENLISQGAKALIVLANDTAAIEPAFQTALDAGIPIVAYDRLVENPNALYITFDNKGVGKLQAENIFALVPKGNYAIIKGNQADPNADFLKSGMDEVIGAAVASGDIKVVCETYTDGWDPANAQAEMEQCLTANDNKIDAVLSENDGMAGGVIAALQAQGMVIPVSGQDGDKAALNRVALGTQTVSVWKDARLLGKAAGEAAVALAGGAPPADVAGVVDFTTPGGNTMKSIFLAPDPITQANLSDVIDAGWITQAEVCQGVTDPAIAACAAAPAASPAG